MELKPGYKQTDLGVIPEDWESIQFGECGSTHGGLSGKSAQDFFQEANCQFVTFTSVMQNISIGAESLSRVQVEDGERQFEVERGDLIFNGSSETPEEVAMASVAEELGQHVFLNSFCFALRPNQSKVHPLFVAYWCRAEFGRRCFSQLAQGSTRYNVSKALFKRAQLPYPPLPEQLAIAEVLSDVDAEIELLARRYEKLVNRKQGLSEELLSGRTRLVEPKSRGFTQSDVGLIPEDWEVVRLGEKCHIVMGTSPPSHTYTNDIGLPLVQGKADLTHRMTYPRKSTTSPINETERGDLIFTVRAPVGYVAISTGNYAIGRGVCAIRNASTFLFHWLCHIESNWDSDSAGTTFSAINRSELSKISIPNPPQEEQQAIAEVLSDLDAEIHAVAKLKAKVQAKKEGLTQTLLTGKIRLT